MTKLRTINETAGRTQSTKQLLLRIAREYLSIPTLEPRNSDSLDFHSLSVWGIKEALNAAFRAGAQAAVTRDSESAIDIHQLLGQRRQVGVVWGVEDVQEVRPDLTDDQAWMVLQRCYEIHDCNGGFTWHSIECAADDLFPSPDEGDGQ